MKNFLKLLNNMANRIWLIIIVVLLLTSCKTYIDNNKMFCENKSNRDLCFICKNDYIEMNFTPYYATGYHEKYIPISFQIHLPRNIKIIIGQGELFYIKYYGKQVVLIKQHLLLKDQDISDTVFFPNQIQIDNYLEGIDSEIFGIISNENLSTLNRKRKSLIIRKCRIEILLLNIKPSHFNTFVNLLNEIKFLPFQGDLNNFNLNEIHNIGKTCE